MKSLIILFVLSLVFTSCTKDEVITPCEENKEAESPKIIDKEGEGSDSFGDF